MKKSELKAKYPVQYKKFKKLAKKLNLKLVAKTPDNGYGGYKHDNSVFQIKEYDKKFCKKEQKFIPVEPFLRGIIVCTCYNCGDGGGIFLD